MTHSAERSQGLWALTILGSSACFVPSSVGSLQVTLLMFVKCPRAKGEMGEKKMGQSEA